MNLKIEDALRTVLDYIRLESLPVHAEVREAAQILETYLNTFSN